MTDTLGFMAQVTAVCVVHEVRPDAGRVGQTAIDKRPCSGTVVVGERGLAGDVQCDTKHHGGPEQALYAYATEDVVWWQHELGVPLAAGIFGENLRLTGVDVTGARPGDVWVIGQSGLQVAVTKPRIPCATFSRWLDQPQWVKRFADAGRPGTYLRVLQPGTVQAGAVVTVRPVGGQGSTIGEIFAAKMARS